MPVLHNISSTTTTKPCPYQTPLTSFLLALSFTLTPVLFLLFFLSITKLLKQIGWYNTSVFDREINGEGRCLLPTQTKNHLYGTFDIKKSHRYSYGFDIEEGEGENQGEYQSDWGDQQMRFWSEKKRVWTPAWPGRGILKKTVHVAGNEMENGWGRSKGSEKKKVRFAIDLEMEDYEGLSGLFEGISQ